LVPRALAFFIKQALYHLPDTPVPSMSKDQSDSHFTHLKICVSLRELKDNTTTSQASVDFTVCVQSVVNTTSLLLVQHNLQSLAAIFLGTDTLADNLNWVDKVAEDGIVHSGESSGTRTLLSLGSTGSVASLWAGKDATGSHDDDVTVRELLLELTGEALLNSVEACKGWDGDKDDNSLLAVANFNLSCVDELKWAKGGFQIGSVGLEVVESASDAGLKLRWACSAWARGRDLVECTHGG